MEIIKKIKKNMTNVEIESLIRQNMNIWAHGYKSDLFQNIGDTAIFKTIEHHPVHVFLVRSISEIRNISKDKVAITSSEKNSTIKNTQKSIEPQDIDPWNVSVPPNQNEKKYKSNKIPVPNTRSIVICETCNGQGHIHCSKCHSEGKIICPTCNGDGKIQCTSCLGLSTTNCTYCLGQGYKNELKYHESFDSQGNSTKSPYYTSVPCIYCQGKGKFRCSRCSSGIIVCTTCGGSLNLPCPSCGGRGKSECTTCKGDGKTIWELFLNQEFKFFENNRVLVEPSVKDKFPNYDPYQKNNVPVLYLIDECESSQQLNQSTFLRIIPDSYIRNENLTNALEELMQKNSSDIEGKLLQQKVSYYQGDMYIVDYEINNCEYSLLLDSYTDTIYAPNNPFSEMAKDVFSQARTELSSKNYAVAMKLAKSGLNLSQGTIHEEEAKDLINSISRLMVANYYKGFLIGLSIFYAYSVVTNLILYFSSRNAESKNLIILAGLMFVLIAIPKFFENNITNFLKKYPIQNDTARTVVGAVIGIISAFLISIFF